MTLLFEQKQKPSRKQINILWLLAGWLFMTGVGLSTANAAEQSIQAKAQKLKSEVVELNRALFELEEELLYPADTQVALFLSALSSN